MTRKAHPKSHYFGDELTITPEHVYYSRRHFLRQLALIPPLASSFVSSFASGLMTEYVAGEELTTPYKLATSYNNYYEFTDNKKMVKHIAKTFNSAPWTLSLQGVDGKALKLDLKDILSIPTQTRIYRLRCVEGWSAVIPWQGFELRELIKLINNDSDSGFVEFTGHHDPKQMIGQRSNQFPWPYKEGLRLDEAIHPLTFVATGMYNRPLPPQSGAPMRLVVPWKYGYKSLKALKRITLKEEQPLGSWQQKAPSEYGFYANVNPNIAHPRWSQRREVRLGETKKQRTEMLNGYAKYLMNLYTEEELENLR